MSSVSLQSNFRVVVRVRPPLEREKPKDPIVDFMPIAQISEDHKVCSMQEYLGGELTEEGRQRDILEHPSLVVAYHSFGFDYVYGPDSTQSFVYDTTARPAV